MRKLYTLLALIIVSLVVLASCNTEEDNRITSDDPNKDITKISTKSPVDQQLSNKVKEKILNKEEIVAVRGVNTETRIIIAIELEQLEQFNEQDMEKDIKKELEKEYPNKNITVSSDQKLFFELDELEKKIQNNNIKSGELTKKVEELETLLKDEA